MMSHSKYDQYNMDHMLMTKVAIETRMIAQAWGHNPGEKVLGAPQLYLFEPHQTEQMGWKTRRIFRHYRCLGQKKGCNRMYGRSASFMEILYERCRK